MDGNERDSYARHQAANAKREQRIRRIAYLNDRCRHFGSPHRIVLTPGLRALGPFMMLECIRKLRLYDDFSPDNDPYGERDFGSFEHAGETVFWKIDYYDPTMEAGSPDPSNPEVTLRVITLMLAAEY